MRPQKKYTYGWIVWAGISATGFAILEGYALYKGEHGDTLSCHTRRITGIHPRQPWHFAGRAAVIGFCGWFTHHICFAPGDDPRQRANPNP